MKWNSIQYVIDYNTQIQFLRISYSNDWSIWKKNSTIDINQVHYSLEAPNNWVQSKQSTNRA